MKKIFILLGTVAMVAVVGWLVAKKSGWVGYRGPVIGELKVLSHSPEGDEIPISTDGITVLFDQAVIPLTTLDGGRNKAVPLKVTPKIDGKFFWLGTHGFIFRPSAPFEPATTYQVELPAGVVSVNGYKLEKALTWKFSTVSPRIKDWEPGENQTLLPKTASFFLRFNLKMNQADVEKKLSVTDETTGQVLLMKRDYIWGDDGHTLRVQFKEELPWESGIKVTLPAGALAKKGSISLTEPVTVTYKTPGKKLLVEKVDAYGPSDAAEIVFQPNRETVAEMGSGVCYHFTQAIDKKSFERAFHVEPRKTPYFYFSGQEIYSVVQSDGSLKDVEGYRNGCIAFLDDYAKTYRFSIDPEKIESLSGARLESGGDPYIARTRDAGPEIRSLLTKNILSANGPEGSLRIPYRGINLKSVTVRLYRLPKKEDYQEDIRDDAIWGAEKSTGPAVGSIGRGAELKVPVDAATMTIDTARMTPEATHEVPVTSDPNVSTRFLVDLASLTSVGEPQGPRPGLYLLEVIGNLAPGLDAAARKGTRSVYSVIQITSVGIAIKREADHVLVWTTDIEKGEPLSGLPVRVTLKKWNSSLGGYEPVTEGNVITNEEGVGVLNLSSEDDVQACAEVTQPGSESYACESEHRISDYRNRLKPGPHYFTYVYTDRPIYRPGQTVYFSSFLREVREGRYFLPGVGATAEVTITDASGENVFSEPQAVLQPGGVVSGKFEIPSEEDTPRGDYQLMIKMGSQTFARTFVVSSYRKPSFKVDLKTDRQEIVSDEEMKVEVQGSYFFGAPLRKAKTRWSIMTTTYLFSPEGYGDFSFIDDDLLRRKQDGDGGTSYASDYEYDLVASSSLDWPTAEDQGQYDDPRGAGANRGGGDFFKGPDQEPVSARPTALDDRGLLTLRYKPDLKKYPTSQTLTVEANVQDPSHQEVSGAEDVVVHKAAFYLGVRPEKWVYGAKEKAKIDLVSLDTEGKAASRKSFTVDVVRRDYKYIEKRTKSGYWDLVVEPQDTLVKTLSGKTDGDGRGDVEYAFPEGGTYRLVAKGKDGDGHETQAAAEVYAWGEGYIPWKLDRPETVELVPDKDSYRIGDTAKILVKSLVPVTQALLTLERGRVLEYKIIELGGNAAHIELPITEGMIPNLYVNVVAHVGRVSEAGNGMSPHPPLLYYGETEIHVEPDKKRLSVEITSDRAPEGDQPPIYRPGDKVTVKLKTTDPSGRPKKANVIVSVADESVLRLLNYELPDLVKKFYYRRPNGVVSSSSLFSLKAGDSGEGAGKKRRIFKDTAHFEGHLVTDEKGEATFTFTLPDDLTTWVIEALAATDSKTAAAFEVERLGAARLRPPGQTAVGSDLTLTDDTFVGGSRAKIMTTLPLILRAALPRFGVWGDDISGRVIANNRNPQEVEGAIYVTVSGDAALKGGKTSEEIPFSIPAHSEKAFPIELAVTSAASGKLTFSAEAKDKKGVDLDALEVSLPVMDRYAPEVVASSGTTQTEEKEQIELPKDLSSDKGGLEVSFKASIGLAAAPSLRSLIYYPWGCSEQKSATLLALLLAYDLSQRFGEPYFDTLAPVKKELIEKTSGLDAKLKLLEDQILTIGDELQTKFLDGSGGIKYWPDSRQPDFQASAQTLIALTIAHSRGLLGYDAANGIKGWLRGEIQSNTRLGPDAKAFALWGLTLDGSEEYNLTEDVLKVLRDLSTTGLSHLLMAMKNEGWKGDWKNVTGRLLSLAKQEPRHTSWPESDFFSSSEEKNTSLAALALLTAESETEVHPMVPRALAFLLNRKKIREDQVTQNSLYLSWLIAEFTKRAQEDKTDFRATLTAEEKTLLEQSFQRDNLLSIHGVNVPMKDLKELKQPADLTLKKEGAGTLYYDMVLKYYLPPEQTPTREEGLLISREYYAMDDVKEESPLTQFKVGENYKGHLALVVPQDLNYILIQDLLPAGFEPIDMTLATTSRAAMVQARGSDNEMPGDYEEEYEDARYVSYDDVIEAQDYGTDYGFAHQEIRDDSIVWSDEYVPAGVYHIRYPVRATTEGTYLMPGAIAFEFYEPEIFGRSRTRVIEIKE